MYLNQKSMTGKESIHSLKGNKLMDEIFDHSYSCNILLAFDLSWI